MLAIGGRDGYVSMTSLVEGGEGEGGGTPHQLQAHMFHFDSGGVMNLEVDSTCTTVLAVNQSGVLQVFQVNQPTLEQR